MKQLIHTMMLISLMGITYLLIANDVKQTKHIYEQDEKSEHYSPGIKPETTVSPENSADSSLPAMDDVLTGKKMKYWIY